MALTKGLRYRDVLALLKAMAADARVSSDALREILGGNMGDASTTRYTQADIATVLTLAATLGWDLASIHTIDQAGAVELDAQAAPADYQTEIRRLHGELRAARERVTDLERVYANGQRKSQERFAHRKAQLVAADLPSVDAAVDLLAKFRARCTCGLTVSA